MKKKVLVLLCFLFCICVCLSAPAFAGMDIDIPDGLYDPPSAVKLTNWTINHPLGDEYRYVAVISGYYKPSYGDVLRIWSIYRIPKNDTLVIEAGTVRSSSGAKIDGFIMDDYNGYHSHDNKSIYICLILV